MRIIKLKNSSNSSAPVNLEQGELAIGTLAGFEKLYFKNSEDSIININDFYNKIKLNLGHYNSEKITEETLEQLI